MKKRMWLLSAPLVSMLCIASLAAAQQPSIAEIAGETRSIASPTTQTAALPVATPPNTTPNGVDAFATLLSTSTLDWRKTGDATWATKYVGNNTADIDVTLTVVQGLAVVQSIVAPNVRLNSDQLMALLRANYSLDLVKMSFQNDALVAINTTELRLLDGAGLKRIVDSVTNGADGLAGAFAGAAAPATAVASGRWNPEACNAERDSLMLLQSQIALNISQLQVMAGAPAPASRGGGNQTFNAIKTDERITGLTKQCFYDAMGSTYVHTVGSTELCPLSIGVGAGASTTTPGSAVADALQATLARRRNDSRFNAFAALIGSQEEQFKVRQHAWEQACIVDGKP